MAHSVVKVTDVKDNELNDSLLLLVGEDGTVTPDQHTVESFLKQRHGPTNIQIMKINRSEKQGIDILVDNVTYMPDMNSDEVKTEFEMDKLERNLYSFKLDHDYTPLMSPNEPSSPLEEDELAKTLSILDGPNTIDDASKEPVFILNGAPDGLPKVKLIQSITLTPANSLTGRVPIAASTDPTSAYVSNESDSNVQQTEAQQATPAKQRVKVIRTQIQKLQKPDKKIVKTHSQLTAGKEVTQEDSEHEEYLDEDFNFELDDDDNDSDYDFDEEFKTKLQKRGKRRKSESKTPVKAVKSVAKRKEAKETPKIDKTETKLEKKPDQRIEPEVKLVDKKPIKKEKKTPKPILDDFALFSTPDIIRRVGGKDGGEIPKTPDATNTSKPHKITQESRSKSIGSEQHSSTKSRTSLDNQTCERLAEKSKERRSSWGDLKSKRISTDEKFKTEPKVESQKYSHESKKKVSENVGDNEEIPSAEDIRSIIMNEDTKSYTSGTLPLDSALNSENQNLDSNLNLDSAVLDLDPTLLDNLNNDEISEDILYQVAQSLVSNPELQNAIDKGITDGVLDPMGVEQNVINTEELEMNESTSDSPQKGTHIIRPDGRIVVIPPIERPTTRSRNRKREEVKSMFKQLHKPLDEQHVSGNELDSNEEEDESEDDPNKLWCICNQPHNNRFMICCDTCEEWYHGKCVNITKAMGQQMESEGKEWICLFCKDPMLKRPQAAARRIRKASRNSRASTDSTGSAATKKIDSPPKKPEGATSMPCVVCQKPSRKSSIYCSESCILMHAQGIERVVVFERSTGNMLTGNKAPSAANLEQWLKEHPGYEVVRSRGKVVTAKTGTMQSKVLMQSKLKLVKNIDSEGVSVALQNRGVNLGVVKHAPKENVDQLPKNPLKGKIFKIIKTDSIAKEPPKTKLLQLQTGTRMVTPTTQARAKLAQAATLKSPTLVPTPTKPKAKETPKPMPVKTPKARQQESTPTKPQENIRENVQKTLLEQLTNRLKSDVDIIKLTEEELKGISTEIETELYKCFGDTGQKYRNKYRSLIFNIKDAKNQTLWRRICEKSINPYELVRLSPDDLASQELAKWREQEAKHQLDMIKKSELELLNCNRQYVLKTHKGEQVLEDDRTDKIDNTDVIKSLTEGSSLDSLDQKQELSKDQTKKNNLKQTHKDKSRHKDKDRKSSKDKDHRSHSRDRSRKRSKSRDRTSKHSEHKKRSRSRDRDRHRKSSHKSSRHKKDAISSTDKLDKKSKEILEQLVDNKIVPPLEDRLWKHVPQEDLVPVAESDSDHEPSSTVTIPTPPRSQETEDFPGNPTILSDKIQPKSPAKESEPVNVLEESKSPVKASPQPPLEIWRGIINMIDVAQISITAHEVSGECWGLGKELPANLDIVGRISPDTVWDYIGKMKCSNSKVISLLRLNATNIEEKMPYLALYSYLSSRNRLGVVKSTNKAVKDFYILPLAPLKPIPQALLPLNGPGFEESRPALLLGIIVRDKKKRPYVSDPVQPAATPKRAKVVTPPPPPQPVAVQPAAPSRSYTPPPVRDPRLKLPLPPSRPATPIDEGDEPYSPEDSDPDAPAPLLAPPPAAVVPAETQPSSSSGSYPAKPSLSATPLPLNQVEIQRQMEELNKEIEMQRSEITSMTQNIVSATSSSSSDIGTTALANIALPSNLQQILDSIKTIGETPESQPLNRSEINQSDLTIPLMIPKTFTRPLSSSAQPRSDPSPVSDTIPLNLPSKPKIKPPTVNSPVIEEKSSVLGSLSNEELIRKAAEMLGEEEPNPKRARPEKDTVTPSKRTKVEVSLPPVPGIDDQVL